ncbi:ribosomal RNA processing protein 1 homolog isoform X2 [Cotesia glomerata]|uniref:ribosomal RNA processing protein 1 homolog isoform X2 n=1 Tax=Cotesia glomerata TaxID=32391 RepID=UPI001D030D42|nr:ribosomal RNA processing protein 1 homolog isoform X2 [Cotesia glomerata]
MAVKTPQQKKSLVIAQEIKFARILAGNNKNARAKKLKKLRTWLTLRSRSTIAFSESDFMRIWKGLYYCMWMSDKPLVQEELAESISQLIFCFDSKDVALLYTKCALNTLNIEWFGIDQYRLDKFEMLARRIIRQTFAMCKRHSWNEKWVKGFADIIDFLLFDPKGSLGFRFHIIELFMEELAKVSEGNIPEDIVTDLLRPFAKYLGSLRDEREIRHVTKHIFRYLIFQSDVGMEYMEKFDAWRKAGYPTGSIDAMTKVEVDDQDEDENEEETNSKENPLDPRAGRVDVELPQVPFDAMQVVELLQQYKRLPSSRAKTRRLVKKLIDEFTNLSQGEMPIGVKTVEVFKKKPKDINPSKAAARFLAFENKLYSDSKLRRLKKKKRKRALEMETNGIADDGQNNEDIEEEHEEEEEEAAVEKPKLKKQKIDTDEDEVTAKSPEKTLKKRKSKQVEELSNGNFTDKSKLKKSIQNKSEMKSKKVKTNKLKSRRNSILSQMYDEIADFSDFKAGLQCKNKKHLKYDLDNSWDVSINDCPSTPTSPVIPPADSASSTTPSPPSTPKSCLPDKVVSVPILSTPQFPALKKIKIQENVRVEATITNDPGSSLKKRVKIVLDRNTAQNTTEYMKQLRSSPAIPFDASRKPLVGVLKPSPISSPINPFYKKLM